MFNQAFFEKVLVIQDDDSTGDIRLEPEFREPFGTLLGSELKTAEAAFQRAHEASKSNATSRKGRPGVAKRGFFQVNSLSNRLLGLFGFKRGATCRRSRRCEDEGASELSCET